MVVTVVCLLGSAEEEKGVGSNNSTGKCAVALQG